MIKIDELKRRMEGAVSAFKHELSGLRTGRASGALLDAIKVEAYGALTPVHQLANISVPEPRMLAVTVWDKSLVSAVEKAIRASNMGLNPITDGMTLRIPLPDLNEERRRELVKFANNYAEQARITVRHVRRDGMDELKKAEKGGEIGQDESRIEADKVQKLTDDIISEIDKILAAKQEEIMQV